MKGGTTLSLIKSLKDFLRQVSAIANCQGKVGLVRYLKMVSVLTQQVIGKNKILTTTPRVKRTRSGIPCIIPGYMRRRLMRGDTFIIRLILTITSLYRDIIYPSKVNTSSITDPFSGDRDQISRIIKFIPRFIKVFIPSNLVGPSLIAGKLKYFPISTSSPQTSIRQWDQESESPLIISSTSLISLVRSASVMPLKYISYFNELLKVIGPRNPGVFPDFGTILMNTMTYGSKLLIGPLRPKSGVLGKLGLKQEAAGKMRVFAMLDPWTQ
jgi:hypothetical protein